MTPRGGESLTPTDGTEINARICFWKDQNKFLVKFFFSLGAKRPREVFSKANARFVGKNNKAKKSPVSSESNLHVLNSAHNGRTQHRKLDTRRWKLEEMHNAFWFSSF